jgi:hypothetical protein
LQRENPCSLLALNNRISEKNGDKMTRKALRIMAALALMAIVTGQVLAKEITVRGKLNKTVEPGGWVIATDKQQYLILNAKRFQDEKWFTEGAQVEAVGEPKPDVMTTYMQGTPFEVRTMRPLEQGGSMATAMPGRAFTRVMVSGDSIVQAQPDTAILTLAVVTQSKQALEAQQQNAAKTEAVVRALKAAIGSGAEIKTSGYSLQPQRVYRENQPPTITGYEARNTVTVTLSDLTKVGALIDAASLAGANDISGIAFTLRQDRSSRDEALRQATREALGKAQVIAQALGGRVARIVEVQEEGTVRPLPAYDRMELKSAQASTPIEVGTLDITSRVQLIAEVEVG